MRLSRDFRDLLLLRYEHEVEYLVVGGYATSVYAKPRYTKDIDIWVCPSLENGSRIVAALDAFGFGSLGLTQKDFASLDTIVQLGYEPNRIDLLTELAGLSFAECYARRERFRLDSQLIVSLISRQDLLLNKRAVGRPQDLADVAAIESSPEPRFFA